MLSDLAEGSGRNVTSVGVVMVILVSGKHGLGIPNLLVTCLFSPFRGDPRYFVADAGWLYIHSPVRVGSIRVLLWMASHGTCQDPLEYHPDKK